MKSEHAENQTSKCPDLVLYCNVICCRAALEIFGTMNEVFAVDTSPKMNDFARLLLQGGNEQARLPAGYFFRLHLPRETEVKIKLSKPFWLW